MYNEAFPKATETTFILDDLTTTCRKVANSPVRLVKDGEWSVRLTFTSKAKDGVVTRFLFLQEKIEIVQDGKTIEEGYLIGTALIALEKKMENEEPPTKPKD